MFRVAVTLVFGLTLTSACCDKETKRLQSHWLRTLESYALSPVELERRTNEKSESLNISPGQTTQGDLFEGREISGFIFVQHYGFWFDVTNKSSRSIRLLWPEARYLDEKGVRHELFRQPMGALPPPSEMRISKPVTVEAGGRVHDVIAPIYKSYLVASGCKDLVPYREPLIPTKLDDKNEHQMKVYVDDLARRQVPVRLLLPIEIEGMRYDYTFTFVLKDRWSDLPKQ